MRRRATVRRVISPCFQYLYRGERIADFEIGRGRALSFRELEEQVPDGFDKFDTYCFSIIYINITQLIRLLLYIRVISQFTALLTEPVSER